MRLRAVPCSSQFRPEANQNLTAGTRNFRKVRRDSDADKDTVFQTRSGASMKESALSRACLGRSSGKNLVFADQDSLLISAGGTRSDPAIYSATSTMIISSNSLAGAGCPISLTVIDGGPCTSSGLPPCKPNFKVC